jgi:hypothetical protein
MREFEKGVRTYFYIKKLIKFLVFFVLGFIAGISINKVSAQTITFEQNMTNWSTVYPERFDFGYDAPTKISRVTNTGGGWFEHLYKKIELEKGEYTFKFDYYVANSYQLLSNYPGITFDILHFEPTYSTTHNLSNIKATLSKNQMSAYETITVNFTIEQKGTYYLDFNWGQIHDNAITTVYFKNFNLNEKPVNNPSNEFIDWTSQYEKANDFLNKPNMKQNVEYLIQKLDAIFSNYLITYNINTDSLNITLPKSKKDFYLDFSTFRYSEASYMFGNGSIYISNHGVADTLNLNTLNKDFIDSYIDILNDHWDDDPYTYTISQWWLNENEIVPFYYSTSNTFTIKNLEKKINIEDKRYAEFIPTVLHLYKKADNYIFNEIINPLNSGISGIKVKFNVFEKSENISFNLAYDMDFKEETSIPEIEIINNDNRLTSESERIPITDKDTKNSMVKATDTFNINILKVDEMYLNFDFYNLKDKDIDMSIYFESNISFTFEYIYENNNYATVDFTGFYGVVFMPKRVFGNDKVTVNKPFFINSDNENNKNKYQIHVIDYEDVNKGNVLHEVKNYKAKSFQYMFELQKLNKFIIFKNEEYEFTEDTSKIDYDYNYFTYQILENEYSMISIENMDTGEHLDMLQPKPEREKISVNYFMEQLKKGTSYFGKVPVLFGVVVEAIFSSTLGTLLFFSILAFCLLLIVYALRRK